MRVSLLSFTLMVTVMHLLYAAAVKAQDMTIEHVTVSLKEEPVLSAIKQIEKQTSLRFFYHKADLTALGLFNMPAAARTVEETLYALLQNSALSFRQLDQTILIQNAGRFARAKRQISGIIFDAASRLPLQYASVELVRKGSFELIGHSATDSLGRFEITTNDQDTVHVLRVVLMGYKLYRRQITDMGNVILPPVYLTPDTKELQEVVVAARSPLVRQEVDRLSYNVQADPDNKFSSLLDMLRKVPLVSVDADDNVKLKGSASFKVLIDGHASSLVVSDPKEIFQSMAASSIQRIEVITIPPAKYDSEGLAGIINIITVKKLNNGYSGNFGTLYKFPNGPRANGSINLKEGKFALSAFGGWNEYNIPQTAYSNFRRSTPGSPLQSTINQDGDAQTNSKQGYLSAQSSYELDSLNLISVTLGYNGGHSTREGYISTQQTDSIYHTYHLDNNATGKRHGYDLGLDYQLGFRRNKGELLSLSYRYSSTGNSQFNALTASGQLNYDISNYNQNNNAGTDEHTVQVDYTYPLKYIEIEAGIKTIFRNNFSDYTVNFADPFGTSLTGANSSNDFSYQQNIYGLYNSYQLNLGQWTVKAGLRLEITDVQADFSNGGDILIPGYNNLIPSIAAQRKLTQTESINFGYTERIQRPGILQLNPYVDQQNPTFITYGNPGLKPELNHILSVNYSLFQNISVNAGLSYSFSNNTIQYVSTLGADGITRGTFENLGVNDNLEADLSISLPVSKRVNLSLNAQVANVTLKGIADSVFYKRQAFTGNTILSLGYKFDHQWRTGFGFQYYSPAVTLQGTSSPYYYTSFSLSKTLLDKKLNITVWVSNPYLKYLDYKITTTDPRFNELSNNQIVYRRFNVSLNYSFGKLTGNAIKKNKKTVQNDDIKVVPDVIPNN